MRDAIDLINNVVNQFIVKPTGSSGFIGTGGFVFDVLGDEDATFDADITDHYIESNYAIQDHIALKPPRFTLSGYIGELKDIFQNSFLNILTTIQSMSAIGPYDLVFGSQATQVYGELAGIASQIGTIMNQASNAYHVLTGASTTVSKQQEAYSYFVNLYLDRVLCQVETPWATWQNMAIESIRIVQKADNNMVSEFSITFKQIRTVSTEKYTSIPISATFNGETAATANWQKGRSFEDNIPKSFTAGIAGQSTLTNGTPVTTGLLSQSGNFGSIPGLAELP